MLSLQVKFRVLEQQFRRHIMLDYLLLEYEVEVM